MPLFGKRSVEPADKQRKRIYSEEEIKERLESMNPDMQNTFIRLAEMLMHKESEMFLDIVAKSRQDIQEVGDSIKEEQEVLKTTAKILARERGGADSLEYADVDDEDAQTKIHFESEYNKKVVQDYLKAVGRDVPSRTTEVQKRRNYKLKMDGAAGASYVPEYARRVGSEAGSSDQRPYTAGSGSRPGTAYRMRMSRPGDDDAFGGASASVSASWQGDEARQARQRERTMEEEAKVKEEKEELMEQMKMMDDMMQGEKARQQEAMQARKEARKARKEKKKADEETQAMELMETNQEAEEQKRKNKERQEQILKERLAKKRLERRKTMQDMAAEEPGASASGGSHVPAEELAQELERELGITRAKTSMPDEGDAAGGAKASTKKKGKKKQVEEAAPPPPPPVEANWDVGDETGKKTPRKKKGKKTDAAEPEVVQEAPEEGKKKKKKKAAATAVEAPGAEDTVLNLDIGGDAPPVERKKKGKKKKLSEDMDLTVSEV